jgi:tetratricopeptide (TPR) repeat protein
MVGLETGREQPAEIEAALSAAAAGRVQEALAALQALSRGPQASRAHKATADILAARRYDAEAAKAYRRAIQLDQGFAEAHNNLANVLWRKSKDAAALDHYARAISLKPDYAGARTNLALVKAEVGALDEAVALIEAIPAGERTAAAWRGLAMVLRQAGRLDEAHAAIRRALALGENEVESLAAAAGILRAKGEFDDALGMARRAIDAAPVSPVGYIEAAAALSEAGSHEAAVDYARQAVEVAPSDARGYDMLASELSECGEDEEARTFLEHAIKLDPTYLMAHFRLGILLAAAGHYEKAEAAYRQVIAKQPAYAPALINLAGVLVNLGRPAEAEAILREVVAREPDNGIAWSSLSQALDELARHSEAEEAARKGVALAPDAAQTHLNLGIALQVAGDLRGAQAAFRTALDTDPELVPAVFSIVATDPAGGDDLLDKARALLDRGKLTEDQRSQLYFALANLHDRRGEYGEAFAAATKANLIDRRRSTYDGEQRQEFARSIMAIFDRGFFQRRAAFGSTSAKPIFIVGMPRSGTTLVEQILASHSEVAGGGELAKIPVLASSIAEFVHTERHFPLAALDLDEPATLRMASAYLRTLRERGGAAARVTDKLPSNFFYLGLIALLFPRAAIIACERDPLDVFISGYFVHFRRPIAHTRSQLDFAHFHRIFGDLMEHWQEVLPGRVLTMSYESLVADQAGQTKRLLDHCGLAWEDACLKFHETARPVRTASSTQVRRPLFSASVGRAEPYLAHLDPLRQALGRADGAATAAGVANG